MSQVVAVAVAGHEEIVQLLHLASGAIRADRTDEEPLRVLRLGLTQLEDDAEIDSARSLAFQLGLTVDHVLFVIDEVSDEAALGNPKAAELIEDFVSKIGDSLADIARLESRLPSCTGEALMDFTPKVMDADRDLRKLLSQI